MTHRGLHGDRSAVLSHATIDDRQPQTRSVWTFGAEERIENIWQCLVRDAVSRLLDTAVAIVLDTAILKAELTVQAEFGISGQDAIVLASVLAHLESNRPGVSCFLNRNTKDFDDPDIRKR